MKRTFQALVVLFVSALVFTSCKKDKDDPSIVGKWGITYSEWSENDNGITDGETGNISSASDDYYTVEFTSDGKFTQLGNDGDEDKGTYRTEGNNIYFTFENDTEDDPYEFTVTESELTVSYKYVEPNYSFQSKDKFRRL